MRSTTSAGQLIRRNVNDGLLELVDLNSTLFDVFNKSFGFYDLISILNKSLVCFRISIIRNSYT